MKSALFFYALSICFAVAITTKTPGITKDKCWETESFTMEEKCRQCSSHEASVLNECNLTHYIEQVNCKTSGIVYRSCPKDRNAESSKFWKFELSMIVVALVAGVVVMMRMKLLDRRNMERIQKQLSAL